MLNKREHDILERVMTLLVAAPLIVLCCILDFVWVANDYAKTESHTVTLIGQKQFGVLLANTYQMDDGVVFSRLIDDVDQFNNMHVGHRYTMMVGEKHLNPTLAKDYWFVFMPRAMFAIICIAALWWLLTAGFVMSDYRRYRKEQNAV